MENEDLGKCLDKCLKLLDDNVNILSNIEYELNQQKEDELVPEMQLADLIDMTHDVADSSRLKKAEFTFMQRYFEKSNS
ncbi:MAG: hypothetical protein D4R72_04765 [Nitrosopumilales archaeon]|nr:MAG: hypothetical protein D4R72_04765 [Nitrosopumilales archaeon]